MCYFWIIPLVTNARWRLITNYNINIHSKIMCSIPRQVLEARKKEEGTNELG